jgi:hypothetical protein
LRLFKKNASPLSSQRRDVIEREREKKKKPVLLLLPLFPVSAVTSSRGKEKKKKPV